jgi:hypothetical protein
MSLRFCVYPRFSFPWAAGRRILKNFRLSFCSTLVSFPKAVNLVQKNKLQEEAEKAASCQLLSTLSVI